MTADLVFTHTLDFSGKNSGRKSSCLMQFWSEQDIPSYQMCRLDFTYCHVLAPFGTVWSTVCRDPDGSIKRLREAAVCCSLMEVGKLTRHIFAKATNQFSFPGHQIPTFWCWPSCQLLQNLLVVPLICQLTIRVISIWRILYSKKWFNKHLSSGSQSVTEANFLTLIL